MNTNEFLKNLSQSILYEIGRKNYTTSTFATICGISRSEIDKILNKKNKDIKISTVLKIFENSNIDYPDIFEPEKRNRDKEKSNDLSRFVLTDGKEKYHLVKINRKNQ